jgi:hypothetical protein
MPHYAEFRPKKYLARPTTIGGKPSPDGSDSDNT